MCKEINGKMVPIPPRILAKELLAAKRELKFHPDDINNWKKLIRALYNVDDWAGAHRTANTALKKWPKEASLWIEKVYVYEVEYPDLDFPVRKNVVACLDKALELAPDDGDILEEAARYYRCCGLSFEDDAVICEWKLDRVKKELAYQVPGHAPDEVVVCDTWTGNSTKVWKPALAFVASEARLRRYSLLNAEAMFAVRYLDTAYAILDRLGFIPILSGEDRAIIFNGVSYRRFVKDDDPVDSYWDEPEWERKFGSTDDLIIDNGGFCHVCHRGIPGGEVFLEISHNEQLERDECDEEMERLDSPNWTPAFRVCLYCLAMSKTHPLAGVEKLFPAERATLGNICRLMSGSDPDTIKFLSSDRACIGCGLDGTRPKIYSPVESGINKRMNPSLSGEVTSTYGTSDAVFISGQNDVYTDPKIEWFIGNVCDDCFDMEERESPWE